MVGIISHLILKTRTIPMNVDAKSKASPLDAVVQVREYWLLMTSPNLVNQVIANSSKAMEVIQRNGLDIAPANPPSLGNSLALVLKWLWVGHHPGFVTTGVDQLSATVLRY